MAARLVFARFGPGMFGPQWHLALGHKRCPHERGKRLNIHPRTPQLKPLPAFKVKHVNPSMDVQIQLCSICSTVVSNHANGMDSMFKCCMDAEVFYYCQEKFNQLKSICINFRLRLTVDQFSFQKCSFKLLSSWKSSVGSIFNSVNSVNFNFQFSVSTLTSSLSFATLASLDPPCLDD